MENYLFQEKSGGRSEKSVGRKKNRWAGKKNRVPDKKNRVPPIFLNCLKNQQQITNKQQQIKQQIKQIKGKGGGGKTDGRHTKQERRRAERQQDDGQNVFAKSSSFPTTLFTECGVLDDIICPQPVRCVGYSTGHYVGSLSVTLGTAPPLHSADVMVVDAARAKESTPSGQPS